MAGFLNEFISSVVDSAVKELTKPKRRRRKSTTLRGKVTSTLEKALIEAVLGEKKTTTRKTKTRRLAKRASTRTRTKRRTTRKSTARRTSS